MKQKSLADMKTKSKIETIVEIFHQQGWRLTSKDLKKLDLRLLGSGVSRVVYLDKKTKKVYKTTFGNVDANRTEWNFYRALPKHAKHLFAKPLAISKCGAVMEMEFVDTILDDIYEPLDVDNDINEKVQTRLRHLGIAKWVCDLHNGNIGVKKDRSIKIVDYGFLGVNFSIKTFRQIKSRLKRNKRLARTNSGLVKLTKGQYEKILSTA